MKTIINLTLVLAITVILSSCNSDKSAIAPTAVKPAPSFINQQTSADDIVITGYITKTFLDHYMVPVKIVGAPTDSTYYAFFADEDYKRAVEDNNSIRTGSIIKVTLAKQKIGNVVGLRITTDVAIAKTPLPALLAGQPKQFKQPAKKQQKTPCDSTQTSTQEKVEQTVPDAVGEEETPVGYTVKVTKKK